MKVNMTIEKTSTRQEKIFLLGILKLWDENANLKTTKQISADEVINTIELFGMKLFHRSETKHCIIEMYS